MKAHNFVWQGCCFFHYYLGTSTTDWVQIFTGLLLYAYVEILQVKRAGLWQLPIVSTVFNWHWTRFVKDQYSKNGFLALALVDGVWKKGKTVNMGSIGHWSCKRITNEKTPLLHNFACFQMHNKRLQLKLLINNYWVSEKIPLSPNSCFFFRGSRFSTVF